ncbi:glycosyltransferase [Polynucleobacter paneuropaeus]|nr:glycosyltransferase [Polynucleobacter paneuropaeus]
MSDFFSVVTVVLNDPKGLERTGYSVLRQKIRCNWVIVDGGSCSPTLNILEKFKDSAICISERDSGIYDAMNKGIGISSGKYVVFLNAGDSFFDENTLLNVKAFLDSNAGELIDVLSCGAQLIISPNISMYREPKNAENYIWHGLPSNHQATFYKKDILVSYPYDLKYKICGDYYLASVLYKAKKLFFKFDVPVVNFTVDGISSRWSRLLFLEPYLIQRDILGTSLCSRLLSLLKRFVSNLIIRFVRLPLLETYMTALLPKIKKG